MQDFFQALIKAINQSKEEAENLATWHIERDTGKLRVKESRGRVMACHIGQKFSCFNIIQDSSIIVYTIHFLRHPLPPPKKKGKNLSYILTSRCYMFITWLTNSYTLVFFFLLHSFMTFDLFMTLLKQQCPKFQEQSYGQSNIS